MDARTVEARTRSFTTSAVRSAASRRRRNRPACPFRA
jgi:hypothetical protein